MGIQVANHMHAFKCEPSNDQTKLDLIARTICKGATPDELQLFIHACKRTGLDPFMRQIFAVKRWDSALKREVMTIQTGIDGYRLIADRTGRYAPGRDIEFGYDKNDNLKWAKAFVKKMTPDGQWHEISATAFWNEYVQTTREGKPTVFWHHKGHIMLGKCAEALALRKAFPAELSGIYTKEEMSQEMTAVEVKQKLDVISNTEAQALEVQLSEMEEFRSQLLSRLNRAFGCESFSDLPREQLQNVKKVIEDQQNKE